MHTVVHRGHTSARTRTRVWVLLKLGDGWSDLAAAHAFDVCRNTIKRVHARFLEGGVDAVLTEKVQERRHQALTGGQQAHLIAIACSPVPDGHDHRTPHMLARNAVELDLVEHVSPETIRALMKTRVQALATSAVVLSPQ